MRADALIKANLAASKVNSKKKDQFMMNNLKQKANALTKGSEAKMEMSTPLSEKSTATENYSMKNAESRADNREDKNMNNSDTKDSISDTGHAKDSKRFIDKPVATVDDSNDKILEEEEKFKSYDAGLNPENDADWDEISKANHQNNLHPVEVENIK